MGYTTVSTKMRKTKGKATITSKKANTHNETRNAAILQQRAQKRSLGSGELRKHIPKRYPSQVQILIVHEKTENKLVSLPKAHIIYSYVFS